MNVGKDPSEKPQSIFDAVPHTNFYTARLSVVVPAKVVSAVYQQALRVQRAFSQPFGFHQREVPLKYVEANYQTYVSDQVTEFLFKFYVIDQLHRELVARKLLCTDEPRLAAIDVQPEKDALFHFDLTFVPPFVLQTWKYFPFKAPRRKRYKDLDRQVESFLYEERERLKEYAADQVHVGDWVNLDIALADGDNHTLLDGYAENVWLRIGDEEVDAVFRDMLCGKKIGDCFFTDSEGLQHFFIDQSAGGYQFWVKVCDFVPYQYVCFEQFKQQFRLKTNKEIHQKLVEVFSYRNDLSQRKAMIEESYRLLLSKHPFLVPRSLVLRQEQKLLEVLSKNNDYQVYKMQKNFQYHVEQLAHKQVKETILTDHLAFEEGVEVTHHDIKNYLNLTKRPKTLEFIHFGPVASKTAEQEMPVITAELMQLCRREKTLNYILYHLTKQ